MNKSTKGADDKAGEILGLLLIKGALEHAEEERRKELERQRR